MSVYKMKVELLKKDHDRSRFKCEEETLTEYIQKQVSQDVKKRLATCFVNVNQQNRVLAYYTLSSESLGRESIPEVYQKKVPRNYNAPVILLGRLARDISQKGTGLGELMLLDALHRSYTLSEKSIGAMAVVVFPINEKAKKFYAGYGFIDIPDSGQMFLPMNVIAKLFKGDSTK
jgi:predicted GNAT family N-acyltransferase